MIDDHAHIDKATGYMTQTQASCDEWLPAGVMEHASTDRLHHRPVAADTLDRHAEVRGRVKGLSGSLYDGNVHENSFIGNVVIGRIDRPKSPAPAPTGACDLRRATTGTAERHAGTAAHPVVCLHGERW